MEKIDSKEIDPKNEVHYLLSSYISHFLNNKSFGVKIGS